MRPGAHVHLRAQLFRQEIELKKLREEVEVLDCILTEERQKVDKLKQRVNRFLLAFDALKIKRPTLNGALHEFLPNAVLMELQNKSVRAFGSSLPIYDYAHRHSKF